MPKGVYRRISDHGFKISLGMKSFYKSNPAHPLPVKRQKISIAKKAEFQSKPRRS